MKSVINRLLIGIIILLSICIAVCKAVLIMSEADGGIFPEILFYSFLPQGPPEKYLPDNFPEDGLWYCEELYTEIDFKGFNSLLYDDGFGWTCKGAAKCFKNKEKTDYDTAKIEIPPYGELMKLVLTGDEDVCLAYGQYYYDSEAFTIVDFDREYTFKRESKNM